MLGKINTAFENTSDPLAIWAETRFTCSDISNLNYNTAFIIAYSRLYELYHN